MASRFPVRAHLLLLTGLVWLLAACGGSGSASSEPERRSTAPDLRVAFFGDQGLGSDAREVLELIKAEGADVVIHLGDFDYENDPEAWDRQITTTLGDSFPYFAVVGNHDVDSWEQYQQLLLARLGRIEGAECSGDYGVKASCTYEGLFILLSGAGTLGSEHDAFLGRELDRDTSLWRICAWHKNQAAMQVGDSEDDTGWAVYETCRRGGAIIATAHHHAYARTKTLRSMREQEVDPGWPEARHIQVAPGTTFAFVSGLGGSNVRPQVRCKAINGVEGCRGEWAFIYTEDQQARNGALFIDFYVDGDPRRAKGYFKNVRGQVVDSFVITVKYQ